LVEPYVEHQDLNETIDLPEYTTEHIAAWIYQELKRGLPTLHKIKLWEGKTSFAEITNGDQLR
jgi:6-pyruvoyl-tetrahydropterin synthase